MSQITANGIQLEYEAYGDSSDPALVLIRGLGTQMIDWHPALLQQLTALGLYVVIFDNRDVGLSQKFDDAGVPDLEQVLKGKVKAPYSLSDMAADVIGLMDSLGIDQAHILGISLGGMIGQVLAAKYPGRLISFMSVMSTSGRPGLPGPTEAAVEAFNAPLPEEPEEYIAETAARRVVFGSPGYPESLEVRMASARAGFERCHNPAGVARQRCAAASESDRTALLKTISVPTTVIHGVDDALIPIAHGEDTANLIPGAQFVPVPGMGHNIPEGLVPAFVSIVSKHLIWEGAS